jgi:hypothetical protein
MMRMFFFTGVSYELLLRYDLGEFLVDIDLVVSCIAVWCTQDYELVERSNVQWLCCKCESINVSTFTFRSYEWELSIIYEPISD